MAKMISRGRELIRINSKDARGIEYSSNNGSNWYCRCSGNSNVGEFIDLLDYGKEILAATNKGIFYSSNEGSNWYWRCSVSNIVGEFLELNNNGNELLATTSKGLYYSKNDGKNWYRK